jgi:hypothetical protein
MKSHSEILKDLKKALKLNYDSLIAYRMGYKSSTTVNVWAKRNSIPDWCITRLEIVLDDILNERHKEKIA